MLHKSEDYLVIFHRVLFCPLKAPSFLLFLWDNNIHNQKLHNLTFTECYETHNGCCRLYLFLKTLLVSLFFAFLLIL